MPSYKVKVKWGKESYPDIEVNTEEPPMLFKAQLFALTGVQPERQKVMLKGITLKDEDWGNFKLKDGVTILLMGSKEDVPVEPVEKTRFVEDMNENELATVLDLPAGLTNLGNTCYMNATVQCLKTVPELKEALQQYKGAIVPSGGVVPAQSITAALRDLYSSMEKGNTVPPIVLLQVLHMAFPRFAEKSEHGGFTQQDANECWTEIIRMLQQKLPAKENNTSTAEAYKSIIDHPYHTALGQVANPRSCKSAVTGIPCLPLPVPGYFAVLVCPGLQSRSLDSIFRHVAQASGTGSPTSGGIRPGMLAWPGFSGRDGSHAEARPPDLKGGAHNRGSRASIPLKTTARKSPTPSGEDRLAPPVGPLSPLLLMLIKFS